LVKERKVNSNARDRRFATRLQRSIEANGNYPTSHFHLAIALAHLGRLEEARAAARVGVAIDPHFTIASSLIANRFSDSPAHLAWAPQADGMRKAGIPEGGLRSSCCGKRCRLTNELIEFSFMSILVANFSCDHPSNLRAALDSAGVMLTAFRRKVSTRRTPDVLDGVFRRLLTRPGFLYHLRSLRLR
jgi:hypothetical protein